MMSNALCIDVEPWHSAELVKRHLATTEADDQLSESVNPILNLLERYGTKATFAVLGTVAERYPELVRGIYDKGHEIASHSYSHKTLYDLDRESFEEEIKISVNLIEKITGEKPVGFRAPTFSLDNSTIWALDVLRKYGFKYDASVFPVKTMLYGVPGAPLYPYRPSMEDVTKEDPDGEIIEFPMTVLRLVRNIPVAGGFYLRVLPLWFMKWSIKRVNRTRPGLIYLHPWETYAKTPRVNGMPLFLRFITYFGIGSALSKLEGLLRRFEFKPVKALLNEEFGISM